MNHALSISAAPPTAGGRVRLNAEVLKAHRHRLGLSQDAFALACFERQLCVSIASVKRAETGKPLLLRTARHLAAFFAVDMQGLLVHEGEANGPAMPVALPPPAPTPSAPSAPPKSGAARPHAMRLFGSLLDTVLEDQQSQVMLVQGAAGMGKSRLLAEMAERAQGRFMSAVTMAMQDLGGDAHRAACVAWLCSLLDIQDVTPFWDQLVGQRLRHILLPADQMLLCQDLLGLRMGVDERMRVQTMSPASRAQLTVKLFTRVITRMALQRPLLLLVDDLHTAPACTVELMARVMLACQEAQILWVLASRVEMPQRAQALQALIAEVGVTTLNLAPWRQAEARQPPDVAQGGQLTAASALV